MTTVAVALSGGVDSAVAALLLADQGCEVICVTMRLWHESPQAGQETAGARRVAQALDIPLHVVDVVEPFKQSVVDRFVAEYSAGRTPNPCLYCNHHVKFGPLLEQSLALGAHSMATGHYARTRLTPDGHNWQLLRGVDRTKDQSYFLYTLDQATLAQVRFPLGEWTKDRVRALAREQSLPAAGTKESQDLCFVADNDYRRFLEEHAPHVFEPGPILDGKGREMGRHSGLARYTVGQRSGIGIAAPEALYVLRLDVEHNALFVGPRRELGRDWLVATEVNWVGGKAPSQAITPVVKIRYRARPVQATVTPLAPGRARVCFAGPLRDITPGQGVVFYDGDVVLGGGLISSES